jgi:hypothetical protein
MILKGVFNALALESKSKNRLPGSGVEIED